MLVGLIWLGAYTRRYVHQHNISDFLSFMNLFINYQENAVSAGLVYLDNTIYIQVITKTVKKLSSFINLIQMVSIPCLIIYYIFTLFGNNLRFLIFNSLGWVILMLATCPDLIICFWTIRFHFCERRHY